MRKNIYTYVFIGLIVLLSGIDFAEASSSKGYHFGWGQVDQIQLDIAYAEMTGNEALLIRLNKRIEELFIQQIELVYINVMNLDNPYTLEERVGILESVLYYRPNVLKYQNSLEQLKSELTIK